MDRWRAAGALLALAACIACSAAAPTAGNHSALDLYDGAVVEGCYYNFQHYGEGDRIMTNEPCLNCTCHNRMLMCYLRVCPFTKAIGQNCTVEKRADQCCPIVTCPDVPVDLLTSTSTSSPAEYGATGVGKLDKYGCSIDGKYLPEGAKVPPTPNKPCEHCYCIRNMTTCVMQECTLHVDGCTPIYHKDVCCPVRYSCDHPEDEIPLLDDMTTTVRPTPGFILTTTTVSPVTQMTQDCVHDDHVFADGALIKTEKACEHCYCMKGDIVCVVQECGTPMENEGKNCTSLPPREGQCCPDTYICEGDEPSTEYPSEFTTTLPVEELTTLSPPRRVGVEGSGYRNEPDEMPLTELPFSPSEDEGSGEDNTMVPPKVISETPVDETQRPYITEQEIITTESVSLVTEKIALESEIKEGKGKPGEEKEKPDITNYEKSTIASITEPNLEKISLETSAPVLEESESPSTELSKYSTEIQNEKETTEPYKQESKITSSFDVEPTTVSVTELSYHEITTSGPYDKKEHTPDVSKITSSPVYKEHEKPTPEQNIEETTTSDSTTGLESHGSTPADSHTLTLEEVEKEETETDKHMIDTEKSTEEFTTKSHEYVSSPDTSISPQEEESHTTHVGTGEGFDKEITETHEFIPVTTSISTVDLEHATTESDKEDGITEKEPDEESYETPQYITSVPHVEIESTTQHKEAIVTVAEEAEKYPVSESQESLPSTTSVTHTKDTKTPIVDFNISTDRTTESEAYISSITNTPILSSESTEKHITPEVIANEKRTTTLTPTLEEKDHILTTEMQSEFHTTTAASKTESSVDYLTTAFTDFDVESQTSSTIIGEEVTSQNTKYATSSELSLIGVDSDDTTTEPDKGLNTIPADGIDEDIVTPISHVSESESYITKSDEMSMATESGIKKDDVASEKVHKTTTELYVEKELSTTDYKESLDTKEKETRYTTLASADYGHIVTDHATQSTTEFISITTVPETELEKESSTEHVFEKTDIPEKVNQGENEINKDILVPGRIPGEGDCLLNGVTYRNESYVPSTNNCHTGCKCVSSIIKCDPIICSPPPDYMDNCQPTYDPPDACCPTYECTHISKETMPPQSHSQMSGTEAPIKPHFECRGDQCEISEDKVQPTVSHETCTEGECEVDVNKKIESTKCGPQGCDYVSEISVPQVVDSEHTDICTNGKCDSTQLPPVIEQTKPSVETGNKIICKEETGCQEVIDHAKNECEGESCRRKETVGTEAKLPSTCTDSECLEKTDTVDEHKVDSHESTISIPLEDVTQTEEQYSHVTVLDTKDQTTMKSEDIVHEISTHTEIPEIHEVITSIPETSNEQIIPQTEIKLDSSSESPIQEETGPAGTEINASTTKEDTAVIKEHDTEKPTETAQDTLYTVNPEEYATEKIEDISSVTHKVEIEEHEIETKIPESVDMPNEFISHEGPQYITESDKKQVIQQSTQATTGIDKMITVNPEAIPSDIEKVQTTESYSTILENQTELDGFSTGKDRDDVIIEHAQDGKVTNYDSEISEFTVSALTDKTTELPTKKEKPDLIPDIHITESNTIDITQPQQFTTEQYHTTDKQQIDEKVTQAQHLPESNVPDATEMEKQVTESVTHIETPLTTTASALIDTATLRQDEETSRPDAPKVADKNEDLNQITTDSLVTEISTPTKSVDSVVLMVTTPKQVQMEYEGATTKPEIYFTVPDKVTVTTYEPHKEHKLESPTTSDIDKEEYVTDEPGLSEEKLTTTPAENYVTDLEALTVIPEQSEDIPKKPELALQLPTKITDTDYEIEKESFTTESPKDSELGDVTKPTQDADVHQQKVSEISEQAYFGEEKLTTETAVSPSMEKEAESEVPTVTVQEELSTEESLAPATDKIFMEITEKEAEKLGKPMGADDSTEGPDSIYETHTDINKVTEHKDTSPVEIPVHELPENFIPVEPDHEQSVTKISMKEDENGKMTTLDDKKIYLEYETTTKASGVELDSHTEEPVKDLSHAYEDGSVVSKPAVTATSATETSERVTMVAEDLATEMPQRETKLPEAESHATTSTSIIKESETKFPVVLEFETKPTSIPLDIDHEQKTTRIPVTSDIQHETDSKSQVEVTTEHLISELLEHTVTETKDKDDRISASVTTTVQEPVTEISKITTEGYKVTVDKEFDMKTTSLSEEGTPKISTKIPTTIIEAKVTDIPDLITIGTEQPSDTNVNDLGMKDSSRFTTETTVDISSEQIYTQKTPESPSVKPGNIYTTSSEIYSTKQEEIRTISPFSVVTEVPEVGTTALEEDITERKDMSTELPKDIEQMTESGVKFSEEISEYSEENTHATPKYEYSESTSDLVELEEHTHKISEESPTSPRSTSEQETSDAESTEKTLEDIETTLQPSSEEETSHAETTERILEEFAATSHPSFEERTSQTEPVDKVSEETITTQLPSRKEETNDVESTDKISEETITTLPPRSQEEINSAEATDRVIEEIITTPRSGEETGHDISTDKSFEETGTTLRPSFEEETSHSEATDKILEEIATTLHPSVEKESSHVDSTDKVEEETMTTLIPSSHKETSSSDGTDKVIEETLITPRPEEEIAHTVSTDKILVEFGTASLPSSEVETSHSEATDKILEETATTLHPSIEKESSHIESTDKVEEETMTTLIPSSHKETSSSDGTDKVIEETLTTPRPEEEIAHTVSTDKILVEIGTTSLPSSEVETSHSEATDKISEETATTLHPSIEKESSHIESTDKVVEEETMTTLIPSSHKETSSSDGTEKVIEKTLTTLRPEEEIAHTVSTDKIFVEIGTTSLPSSEVETSHSEATDKFLEETATTLHPSIEKESSHIESTDKVEEETMTTLIPSSHKETSSSDGTDKVIEEILTTPRPEEEIDHTVSTDKILEEIGTTSLSSSEVETSHSGATDKILEETATTLHPSVEKETSHVESTDKVEEETMTTLLPSSHKETSSADGTEKVIEETLTTPRSEEEIAHTVSTDKILEETGTTLHPSSEQETSHSETTDKILEEKTTTLHPSVEKETSHIESTDKVKEETMTTLLPSSDKETSSFDATDKVMEEIVTTPRSQEEIAHAVSTHNILEEIGITSLPSAEEETSHSEATDKILEETAITLPPSVEKETSHVESTDKVSEESATTSHTSIEEETSPSVATDKILGDISTSQRPTFVEDISHIATTEKSLEEFATTMHPISEGEIIYAKTTVVSDVTATTTRTSLEEETSHAEITEISEDTVTTPRISSEDEKSQGESQKLEPIPEIITEKIIDTQTVMETYRPTEIKEVSETPVKESTETYLPTASLAPEITSQPSTHIEESSSLSSISQETDVKYTTESEEKEMSTEKATKPIEEDKTHLDSEEKPSETIKPQEMLTPGEEIVSATTKMTTVSVEEYVTTHAPASVDKFTKPEERPTETAQSTPAPELPKPSEIQPTDEVPSPGEESPFPPSGTSGYGGETDYGDEDQAFGPGTCRYGGKVYVSAQQIPRDDPCDFCFCFRSDIICLQQSCPPPIHGCHEEPIQGFCCPRYECPVSMATTLNVTTTTTTTTTTLPPHFPTHSYKGAAQRRGCQIKGHTYRVGEVVRASSGPCLHCTCGGDGQMKCDPKACTPEPMLRQMIAAAVSAKRRR